MFRRSTVALFACIIFALALGVSRRPAVGAEVDGGEERGSGAYHYQRGKELVEKGRSLIDAAIVDLTKACEDTSVAVKAHALLGEAYLMKADFENAVSHLEHAFEHSRGDLAVQRKLAFAYLKDNRLTESLETYEAVTNAKPLDPEALYYIGKIYQKKNMWDKALERFRDIKGDPRFERLAKNELAAIESSEVLTVSDIRDEKVRRIIEQAPAQDDYPNAGVLVLLDARDMTIYDNNTGIQDQHRMVKILNDRGKRYYAEVKLTYDDTYETFNVNYARTIHPDGTIVPVGKKHIKIVTPYADYPMYSNYKVLIISMPGVVKDAIIEYSATKYSMKLINEDDFHIDAWVGGTEPKLLQEYSLTFPRGRDIKMKHLCLDIEPERTVQDETETIRWRIENSPVIVWESAMPPVDDIMPKIMITSFESWDVVYRYWKSLCEGKFETDEAIRSKVRELTETADGEEEKARLIYEYVASKIRYVGLEYGEGGLVPHSAVEVFSNKYGDCKDQSVLLVSMMREAGLEAYPALIGMNKGVLHEDMPGFFQFNHCIVSLALDGRHIFMDPISETCPYGYLPPYDQGRTAMIFSDDEYELVTADVFGPESNREHRKIDIVINGDRSIDVTKVGINRGVSGIRGREWLRRNNPIARQEFLEKEISSFCPGAELREHSISDLDDLNEPLTITEVFSAPDYLKNIGNNLLSFHIPTVVIAVKGTEKKNRVNPIYSNYTTAKEYEVRVKIPEKYTLDYVPDELELENKHASFGYHVSEIGDHELLVEIVFSRNVRTVAREDYAAYKEFSDRIAQKLDEGIVLREL